MEGKERGRGAWRGAGAGEKGEEDEGEGFNKSNILINMSFYLGFSNGHCFIISRSQEINGCK